MANEITKAAPEQQGALEVRQQVNQIQYLMKDVLKDGEHYGVVPGTKGKPTLYQSGAEKIAYMFHFVPSYEVERADLGNGHREYDVRCTLTHRETGQVMGGGMGTCSTMESKYRYRNQWENGQKRRVENADIADCWNTVLKMAKKRAFVDAVKSTTAASDIFTQDVEDMPSYMAQPVQATVVEQQSSRQPQQPATPQISAELDAAYKRMGAAIDAWCAAHGANPESSKAGVKKRPEWGEKRLNPAYINSIAAEFEGDTPQQADAAYETDYAADLADNDISF